jgi:hypothetical protein
MQYSRRKLLTTTACFGCTMTTCAMMTAAPGPSLRAGDAVNAPSARLAFTPIGKEYRFDTGVLQGTLRGGGKSQGLGPVLEVASGVPVAGKYGLLSPYRLLTADARYGVAAWEWPSQARLLSDGAVEVHWLADKEHPLDITAVYRFTAANVLDFRATVEPRQEMRRFELFLASYFAGFPESLVYVCRPEGRGRPEFLAARKETGDWQMFPRDGEALRIVADGRWKRPPNPVDWKVLSPLAAPLALRRDAKSGLDALLMAPAEDCFAVSMPYGEENHRSVYFSLFGRDLRAGETASARARLIIGKAITNQQAIESYEAYRRELPIIKFESKGGGSLKSNEAVIVREH